MTYIYIYREREREIYTYNKHLLVSDWLGPRLLRAHGKGPILRPQGHMDASDLALFA